MSRPPRYSEGINKEEGGTQNDCTWLDVLARAGKVKIRNGHFTGCTRPAISGVESVPGIIVPRGELGTDDED